MARGGRFRWSTPALLMLGALSACDHEDRTFAPDVPRLLPDAASDADLDLGPPEDAASPPRPDGDLLPDVSVDLGPAGDPTYRLTLLHVGAGASRLLPEGDFGGAARFVATANALRRGADEGPGQGVLFVSAGGEVAAGASFGASLEDGVPFYETRTLDAAGIDVVALGNHAFDFGPAVLADLVSGFQRPVPFVAANLTFVGEPALAPLAEAERLLGSAIVETGGERIGVVGTTTAALAQVSSPGGVTAADPVSAVQAAVDRLRSDGVDKIVLLAQLEDFEADLALVGALREVDLLVSGAEATVLAKADQPLAPGDAARGPYPMVARDARGATVPVVSTGGGYRYVGRLVVDFDDAGRVTSVDAARSAPVRVAGGEQPEARAPDPAIVAAVEAPLAATLASFDALQIGATEVALDARRGSVRSRETNLGDLVADALLWQARRFARASGAPTPDAALFNGGALRSNRLVPAGPLTERDTHDILPFASFVVIAESVPPAALKRMLETAFAQVESGSGRFPQVAGLKIRWDSQTTAQVVGLDGQVVRPGARVQRVELPDGTVLIDGGAPVGQRTIALATLDFLARGGDGYVVPAPLRPTGVSYQQAVRDYVAGALEGHVRAARYPAGGVGRIERIR